MYFSSPQQVVVGRASRIVFFLLSDMLATGSAALAGLVSVDLLWQVGLLFPVSLAGVAVGVLCYRRAGRVDVRRVALWLLMGLACAVLAQSLWR
jgi:uncharacterized membrane protein YfcA